jgi:hypothetical protein
MTGEEMRKWIDKLYSFPPETVKRVAKLYGISDH